MAQVTITELRDTLYTFIQKKVCASVYLDTVDKNLDMSGEVFVKLDFESSISNVDAYQYGIVRVWLCAKNNNYKNLKELETKFNHSMVEYRFSPNSARIELTPRYTYIDTINDDSITCFIKELRVKLLDNKITNLK